MATFEQKFAIVREVEALKDTDAEVLREIISRHTGCTPSEATAAADRILAALTSLARTAR
jgi:hypothetical protein